MMKSLQLSLSAVFPIFLLMLLGYLLCRWRVGSKALFDGINKLIFYAFLPVLLFYNIYKTDLKTVFDGKVILFCVLGILCVFLVGYGIVCVCTKVPARRGVMLQGLFRSNVAFLGIPLVGAVCGADALGAASVTVAVTVPLVNVLAVICLERFRCGKPKFTALVWGILKNPLLIGCVLGLVCLWSGLRLPAVLETVTAEVAGMATPLAMIALGAGFSFGGMRGRGKEVLITVAAKLLVIPLLAVVTAVLLGFRGVGLVCILCTFGTPVAVASYSMAQQMGGDEKLASQIVVLSSAFCSLTLFFFIWVLDLLQLI